MRETLINESNAGNQRATCRYVVDEEACSRYQDFVSSGGRMGPYSFVDSEQDIANLDRIMFGRPMEMMQKVCKGHIDTRKQVPSAQRLSILRLAREIDNGVVGVESAIALITSEISLDKRNLEIIESAANMGNVRALEILANVDMFEYEMFANDTDAGRASQRYYWRSLYSMALDKITSPRMPKPELKTKIDEYRKMVPTDTLTAIDSRITDSFGKFSIEPRVWKKRVLLPTALNESYCDAE